MVTQKLNIAPSKRKDSWNNIHAAGKLSGKKMKIKNEKDIDKIVYEYRHEKK